LFHLLTPIPEGLPGHCQLPSNGVDVMLVSFDLLHVGGGR
jgi:hypothetical protein